MFQPGRRRVGLAAERGAADSEKPFRVVGRVVGRDVRRAPEVFGPGDHADDLGGAPRVDATPRQALLGWTRAVVFGRDGLRGFRSVTGGGSGFCR